jgi:hypothetical protein
LSAPGEWTTLIEGSDDFYLTGFDLFRDFYVVEGRVRGLDRIELRYYDDPARIEPITFPEASYEAGLADNPEWAVSKLRVTYESMVSPASVYDYDVADKTLELLKVQEIPSGYDASLYETQRLEIPRATARWCRSASFTARTVPQAARCTSMAMAPMALPSGRAFPPRAFLWWIAALPMPSRISAAAMIWAAPGTRRASARRGKTPSTILSMWRARWWRRASPRRGASASAADRRAAN